MDTIKIGIVTVSDRAYHGEYEDRGGPALETYLRDKVQSPWVPEMRLVPDEVKELEAVLLDLIERQECCLVITTGGTGPAPRDITPDVTMAVCTKLLPGFGEVMRQVSLQKVPTAILSRQVAGIRAKTLIINLPGSPKAIAECMDAIIGVIPHAIVLIGGPQIDLIQGTPDPGH